MKILSFRVCVCVYCTSNGNVSYSDFELYILDFCEKKLGDDVFMTHNFVKLEFNNGRGETVRWFKKKKKKKKKKLYNDFPTVKSKVDVNTNIGTSIIVLDCVSSCEIILGDTTIELVPHRNIDWDYSKSGGIPRYVVANVLNCDIVVSKVKFQSFYDGHFLSNPLLPQLWLK